MAARRSTVDPSETEERPTTGLSLGYAYAADEIADKPLREPDRVPQASRPARMARLSHARWSERPILSAGAITFRKGTHMTSSRAAQKFGGMLLIMALGLAGHLSVATADPDNNAKINEFYRDLRIQAQSYSEACIRERNTSRRRDGTTTADQRYAAAQAFLRCVEDKRAALYTTYAAPLEAELTKSNRNYSPTFAKDLAQQFVQADYEAAQADLRAGSADSNFMGTTFGVGVGVSFSKNDVTQADVAPDGTLRVTERQKQVPRAILEAHHYGICQKFLESCRKGDFGVGPFFGLAMSSNELNAFALGIMFGWKDKASSANGAGFSIGLGAVLDKAVSQLAPGFVEGQPLPAGETEPVFVTESKWSPLLFFTKTF